MSDTDQAVVPAGPTRWEAAAARLPVHLMADAYDELGRPARTQRGRAAMASMSTAHTSLTVAMEGDGSVQIHLARGEDRAVFRLDAEPGAGGRRDFTLRYTLEGTADVWRER